MDKGFNSFKQRMGQSSYMFYIGSAAAGMLRTTIGFPIEHPLDSIKT